MTDVVQDDARTDPDDAPRIRVEDPAEGVRRIMLSRPDKRNAQDTRMLYELDAAVEAAAADDDVVVVIVGADGPDFSSGHDTRKVGSIEGMDHQVTLWGCFDGPGIEGTVALECEKFMGLCWRWRNFPKPTIAQVQGRVIAGGLMLVWPWDLIVASEEATFSDPVTAFGVNGVEFFLHPWELGARKAKELLFTGTAISAAQAASLGMVNHVVPRDELEGFVLKLAERIARRPTFGVKLAKASVNATLDAQGMWPAIQAAFGLHSLAHANNLAKFGTIADPTGLRSIRDGAKRNAADAS
jgi:enoyl-CoA hydratase